MPVRFAASLSEHPLAAHAVGEVAGDVLERLGAEPDLVVVFVTPAHLGALEDITATLRAVLSPGTVVGVSASSVIGGTREVEDAPALSVWAGRTGPATPVRLEVRRSGDEATVAGLEPEELRAAGTLLLLVDPFSLPVEGVLEAIHRAAPGLTVIGGLASAARGPGGNRLALDAAVHTDGAVGVLLADRLPTVVSQGCRPIGDPYIVTRSERNVIYELGGRPALDRLLEIVEGLDPDERALAAQGLHIGRVIDEHKPEFGRGDFLVRNVMGGDRDAGAVAVADLVDVGGTVQFHVRDAVTADEDLRSLLIGAEGEAALLFTCTGRGQRLFGVPDHDASIVSEALDSRAVAGMFCAGEIGPVGGRPFLHGFTASVALLPGSVAGPPGAE